jgi:GAF domain-containing protein
MSISSTDKTTLRNHLQSLLQVSKRLSSTLSLNTLIQTIMIEAKRVLNADRCTLFLIDKENNELYAKLGTNNDTHTRTQTKQTNKQQHGAKR